MLSISFILYFDNPSFESMGGSFDAVDGSVHEYFRLEEQNMMITGLVGLGYTRNL